MTKLSDAFRARLLKACTHFNGIQHDVCKAGVDYEVMMAEGVEKFPCLRPDFASKCEKYRLATPEEVQAEIDEIEQAEARFDQGLSTCCGAPLDRSRLCTSGRHKGSGWVHCSKCGQSVAHLHV